MLTGGCHCGAIRYQVEGDVLADISLRVSRVSKTQRLVVVVFMAFSISFPGIRVRFQFLSYPVAAFTP